MSPECLMAVYISQTGLSKSLSLETHLQLFYYLLQTSSKAKICPRGKHLTSQKVHLQVCYSVCSLLKHVFLPWRNIPWLKHCVMFEKGDERVSLSVIERKIKERKYLTSKWEVAGRWMNWRRWIWEGKWVLSRWVNMLSLSSCSLTSFSIMLSKLRWQMKQFVHALLAGVWRRGCRAAPLCFCNGKNAGNAVSLSLKLCHWMGHWMVVVLQ